MAVLETCVWHASDWIAWVDRSGYAAADHEPLVGTALSVRFTESPGDLEAVQRPGRTLLWRRRPEDLRRTVSGTADEGQRRRPAVPAYPLAGEVSDPEGRYLPRRFSVEVGTAAGRSVALYRAPQGTRYQSAGGVRGRVVFEDGTPAAWAVLALEVTPPLAGAMPFAAQADGRGEFLLALDRLPALTKDAPSTAYPATLRVRASLAAAGAWRTDRTLADPDSLPGVKILRPAPPVKFRVSIPVEVTPGNLARLASAGSEDLVLQAT